MRRCRRRRTRCRRQEWRRGREIQDTRAAADFEQGSLWLTERRERAGGSGREGEVGGGGGEELGGRERVMPREKG